MSTWFEAHFCTCTNDLLLLMDEKELDGVLKLINLKELCHKFPVISG